MGEPAKLFDLEGLNTSTFDTLRDQVREHMEATGKSQTEIGKAIGYKSAVISQFLSNKYPGDMNEVAKRLSNYLDREKSRQTVPQEPVFVETGIAQDVFAVADFAHNHNGIGMVYGDAGIGKTLALEKYAALHPDVIFIRARVKIKSARALENAIAEKIGCGKDDVIDALHGTGRLLIVDEAQRLTQSALEFLRDINDEAKIGVLLSGNKDIYDRMRGKKGALFAQMYSRVKMRRYLQCRDIMLRDVEMIFNQAVQLPKNCLEYLHQIAETPNGGGLRQAKDFYLMGLHIARGNSKSTLDLDDLKAAKDVLMGPY
jgi:DNA transposition AAA+ family ATPase